MFGEKVFSDTCGDFSISPWDIKWAKMQEAGSELCKKQKEENYEKSFLGGFFSGLSLSSTSGWQNRNSCFYHLPLFHLEVPRLHMSSVPGEQNPLFSSLLI